MALGPSLQAQQAQVPRDRLTQYWQLQRRANHLSKRQRHKLQQLQHHDHLMLPQGDSPWPRPRPELLVVLRVVLKVVLKVHPLAWLQFPRLENNSRLINNSENW